MTSITFGGGPSIESRRKFSNLKPGSQVPGYGGYIHQFKYNNGHTYGEETHLLSEKFPVLSRSKSEVALPKTSASGADASLPADMRPRPKFVINHQLPKAVSGNKLTENMITGYTGYIPSRKFHFGETYKNECDVCIDDYMSKSDYITTSRKGLMGKVHSYNPHKPVASDSEAKKYTDLYRDLSPNKIYLQPDKREFTEPPMPGYTGHVPRIGTTELGLGTRYHETTKKGFETFARAFTARDAPSNTFKATNENTAQSETGRSFTGNRVFVAPGMIPKYTGYVHGRKYQFGNTYGETTRQLPVCNHSLPNFGEYMSDNPAKTVIC